MGTQDFFELNQVKRLGVKEDNTVSYISLEAFAVFSILGTLCLKFWLSEYVLPTLQAICGQGLCSTPLFLFH